MRNELQIEGIQNFSYKKMTVSAITLLVKNSFFVSLHFEVAINLIGNEHELTGAWLAQSGERPSAEWEVAGSNAGRTSTHRL